MSTALRHSTVQQRAMAATAQLRQLVDADDVRALSAAVAEAAAEEAERNTAFLSTLRRIYTEMTALSKGAQRTRRDTHYSDVELVPLPGTEGARFDPFAPLDPYALLRLYGPQQLRAALNGYSYARLREAVAAVRNKWPGTKPSDARKASSLIDYIVEHLT